MTKSRNYETPSGRKVKPGIDPIPGEYYLSEDKSEAVKVASIYSDSRVKDGRRVHFSVIYDKGKMLRLPMDKVLTVARFRQRDPYISEVTLPNWVDRNVR